MPPLRGLREAFRQRYLPWTAFVLPAATTTRLGGVKIGEGLSVSADGTLSVDGDSVVENIAATDSEVEEALDEIYGAEGTD